MTSGRRLAVLVAVGALAVATCSDDTGNGSPPADGGPTTTTSTTSTTSIAPPAEVEVNDLTASPTAFNTLSTTVTATTDLAAAVSVVAESADGHMVKTPLTAEGVDHEVTVLGLRPETTYDIILAATADGAAGTATTNYTSGPLPDHLPTVRVITSRPEEMAPGVTLVPLGTRGEGWPGTPSRPGEVTDETYTVIAIDDTGEIVWYLDLEGRASDLEITDRGTILYVQSQIGITEITTTGEVVQRWEGRSAAALREGAPAPAGTVFVDTDTMHHEVAVLPNGNILTLSTELLDSGLDDLPCETDQETADGFTVIADIVVEFEPATGTIVNEFRLADVLDPAIQPGGVICDTVPFPTWYPDEPDAGDWTHANAIAVDPARDRLLVSLRHLSSVLALDYGDDEASRGDVLWQLGPDLDFDLAGDEEAEWQYFQHAPEVNDDGTLILYDNGNLRPGTTAVGGDVEPYSRAAIYEIDEEDRVATQLWEHVAVEEDGSPIYADFVGDADVLDNGNVLIGHGGIVVGEFVFDEDLGEEVFFARVKSRLLEVVPEGTSGGETVFEVEFIDERIGRFFFAAERVASMQPLS